MEVSGHSLLRIYMEGISKPRETTFKIFGCQAKIQTQNSQIQSQSANHHVMMFDLNYSIYYTNKCNM